MNEEQKEKGHPKNRFFLEIKTKPSVKDKELGRLIFS